MPTYEIDQPSISFQTAARTLADHMEDFANELSKLPRSIELTALELRFAMLRALMEERLTGEDLPPCGAANQNFAAQERLSRS
jgi:hypothetical protein